MGSQKTNVSSGGKLRLWSDCVDVQTDLNLRCRHLPTCTLCWIPAQFIAYLETEVHKSKSLFPKNKNRQSVSYEDFQI